MAKISALPAVATPTGTETVVVLKDGETQRVGVTPLVETAAAPSIERAGSEADRSEAGALAALLALGDGVYDTIADGLAATPEGDGFYAIDAVGGLSLSRKEAGKAKEMVAFPTRRSMRSNGINLWEVAKRGDSTDPADMAETTAAINSVIEDASRWGVGLINCGGRDRVYHCGGPYTDYGTLDLQAKDGHRVIPFRRGRIRLRSNIELRGASTASRATFRAAPGDRDPGPLFWSPFWEEGSQLHHFAMRWIVLDGNAARQTYSQYARNTPDWHMWIQGHAFACAGMRHFLAYECEVHGWWGHGFFGFDNPATGNRCDDWTIIGCDVHDNMQGGAQVALNRLFCQRNTWHGGGGWTALGVNVETVAESTETVDIRIIDDIVDARDGYNAPVATVRDWRGRPGHDTDSPGALAARIHRRRAHALSGNYYTDQDGTVFGRQRGRVQIARPQLWDATLLCAGFDRVSITDVQSEMRYEDDTLIWPPLGNPITVSPGGRGTKEKVYDQVKVTGMLNVDCDGPIVSLTNFEKIDVDVQTTGGRNAAVRAEICGGRIRVHAKDFGFKTDRAFWKAIFPDMPDKECDAQIGSTSAAVVAFGTQGPLEIDVLAIDTRGENAQMQAAAYLNVGAGDVVGVTGSSDGHLIAPLIDVNNSVFNRGLIGRAERSYVQRGPLLVDGGIEAKGYVTIDGGDGPAEISLQAGAGQPVRVSFVQDGGLEGQIVQLPDGAMQTQIHEKGVIVGAPFAAVNDGTLLLSASWTSPVRERTTGTYLWVTSAGVWRTSMTKPEAEGDGTILGAQGSAAAPAEGS